MPAVRHPGEELAVAWPRGGGGRTSARVGASESSVFSSRDSQHRPKAGSQRPHRRRARCSSPPSLPRHSPPGTPWDETVRSFGDLSARPGRTRSSLQREWRQRSPRDLRGTTGTRYFPETYAEKIAAATRGSGLVDGGRARLSSSTIAVQDSDDAARTSRAPRSSPAIPSTLRPVRRHHEAMERRFRSAELKGRRGLPQRPTQQTNWGPTRATRSVFSPAPTSSPRR